MKIGKAANGVVAFFPIIDNNYQSYTRLSPSWRVIYMVLE